MTYPKPIKNDLKNNLFEYDGGDLWVRENVSYWDDQDYCWENDTGSWRLFGGLEVQPNLHSPTLFCSTYADNKKLT
jgi:hypothetical protein